MSSEFDTKGPTQNKVTLYQNLYPMNSWFGIGPDVTQYRQYSLFGFAFLWWVALWQSHSTPWLISSLLNLHSIHCTIFNSNLLLYWSWAKQGLGPTLCSVCEAFGRALGLSFLSHLSQDKNSFVLREKKKGWMCSKLAFYLSSVWNLGKVHFSSLTSVLN